MVRVLRPVAAAAALLVFAAAGPASFDRAELDALESERAAAISKLAALEAASGDTETDLSRVDSLLMSAATESRRREEQAASSELRLIDLGAQMSSANAELVADEAALEDMIAALIVSGQRTPPALIVSPDKANEAVRSAILLSDATPRIKARTEELTAEIERLTKLGRQIRRERAGLDAAEATLALKKVEIERLAAQKRAQYEDLSGEADTLRKQVAVISSKADSLKALLAGLESNAPRAPGTKPDLRPRFAALTPKPGKTAKDVVAAKPVPQTLKPLGAASLGGMQRPAAGLIARGWGAKTEGGGKSEGLTIVTRQEAQVIAPVDARIEYAGPFRSYGQLLILRTSDGYHILLSGMGRIYGSPGQTVNAGEPVGRMANRASPPPELYIEVRRDGRPMNPAKWMKRDGR